eukprot:7103667-Prymnesium_polylepis.1
MPVRATHVLTGCANHYARDSATGALCTSPEAFVLQPTALFSPCRVRVAGDEGKGGAVWRPFASLVARMWSRIKGSKDVGTLEVDGTVEASCVNPVPGAQVDAQTPFRPSCLMTLARGYARVPLPGTRRRRQVGHECEEIHSLWRLWHASDILISFGRSGDYRRPVRTPSMTERMARSATPLRSWMWGGEV